MVVNNRQALLPREPRISKRPYQGGKFRCRKMRSGQHGQSSQIQHSSIQPAFLARFRQTFEGSLARFKIQMLVGIQADKFTGTNDL